MQEFGEKVELIKSKMKTMGFIFEVNEVSKRQMLLGTPGEVFSAISFYLNQLKISNTTSYRIAKSEIDQIVEYAKSINYIQ